MTAGRTGPKLDIYRLQAGCSPPCTSERGNAWGKRLFGLVDSLQAIPAWSWTWNCASQAGRFP